MTVLRWDARPFAPPPIRRTETPLGMTGLDSVIPDVRRPDQGWQRFPPPTVAPLNCQAQFPRRPLPVPGLRAGPGVRLIDPLTRITSPADPS